MKMNSQGNMSRRKNLNLQKLTLMKHIYDLPERFKVTLIKISHPRQKKYINKGENNRDRNIKKYQTEILELKNK